MPKGSVKRLPKSRRPKKKCCSDRPKCKRCPIRMLADGTLPDGFTVKKRRLVKASSDPGRKAKKSRSGQLPEAA